MSDTTGRDLAARRVHADLLQRDVAAALGVSRQRVHQIERSARVTPAATIRYLAAVERTSRERSA